MTSLPVKESMSVNFQGIQGSVSFHDCFPEIVQLSSNGIVQNSDNDTKFESRFFQRLFDDYPHNCEDSSSSVISIEPFPDCIADFMADRLESGVRMQPGLAKGFFSNRLNSIDSFTLWDEREAIFHSIFPEQPKFAEKLEFLYGSFNHYESSRKLIQFITINQLIELYLENNYNYQLKDVLLPEMSYFREEIYQRYHNLEIVFHDYTYPLADLIFIFDKENLERKKRQLELTLFSNIEMRRVEVKNPVPGYISFNTMFAQQVIPGEIYISELTDIQLKKPYIKQSIKQDETVLKLLKQNSEHRQNRRIHWRDRNIEESIHYLNNALWTRNTLRTMPTLTYKDTINKLNHMFTIYINEHNANKELSFSMLPALMVFTVMLNNESHKRNFPISDKCITDFVLSICRDNSFVYYDNYEIKEIVDSFLREKGLIPPYLIISTLCE